ncbi:hypothetical protein M9Y10_011487 [Tritrichomonas musculus]|uniref:Uncharacterized protein n=1 Tax=Tritrichomonas musculus TaxID=1915356 RepID=A0ABR2IJK3_9EUKA
MKKQRKEKERVPPDQIKITKLVREIISGRSVNQIPDQLLPRVHTELSCAKERAIKEGLINRVQMIQKAMLDVEKYEKEREKLRSAKPKSKIAFLRRDDNYKLYNEDFDIEDTIENYEPPPVAVLDSILDDLADGIPFQIAETPNIPFLIERSKERIDEYLSAGDYFTAQKYEDVHLQLVSLIEERKKEKKIENKVNYLTNLLNENQTKLKEIKEEKRSKLEEHDKKINDSLNKCRTEYEATNNEYDVITNGPLPSSAKKFSSEYLNTREKERFLIQSRRYEEAASIKAEADQMEARELEMLRLDFIEKREKKKKIIEERQNKSLKCIIENGERTRLKINNEYDKKIQEIQRTVENIQSRLKLVDSNDTAALKEQPSSSNVIFYKPPNSNAIQETVINAKKSLPIPRETTTSKLRSSPFVTQATPQITSPEKTVLTKNNKMSKKAEKSQFYSIKAISNDASKFSMSFSSNSFISEDDENDDGQKIDADFIVDEDSEVEVILKANKKKVAERKNDDFEIGKNLIQKKKKSNVKQPNAQQLLKNKNAANYEYNSNLYRPISSTQKKFTSANRRACSQAREQPPSSLVYTPNFNARRKNDKVDNPIRVGRNYSTKK